MKLNRDSAAVQFVKYGMVGVLNTLITLFAIYVCKSIIGINPFVSNAIGYILGVLNSFIWNKTWVFHAKGHVSSEAVKFFVGFGVCYLIQLFVVWALTVHSPLKDAQWDIYSFTLSGYGVATIIGSVVYTVANFIFNRLITFKTRNKTA
jgi:putative flippase GtrA